MEIRFAKETELDRVNEIRKQVNDVHVTGKPEVFKPGFSKELQDFIKVIWDDPEQEIVVAVEDDDICGFAILHHINKPENPFMWERDFLDIDEFCVDEKHRRKGVATKLIDFIKKYAKEKGYGRLELNMWEFNESALEFYESVGFETYRRYMEIML
ncbi:GNAT family N-acetyltransferase [Butyrivibrio sp. CB08]|uniref:GNAT family N-acetyltransferase n=1 Tax=Butyrivibrio sp. CB08 TaxID=2364879 RepID=UPI000EAAA41B|nr:GNAT family N-acetyltransferase [Butyrivibrio sp. CB08]RKM59192.1 GNAT family N-acetyltransferase [Butyrivibrio sp. CB08]